MPKSFLLCPNKRRDLEIFIREELNDSRKLRHAKIEAADRSPSPRRETLQIMTQTNSPPTHLTNTEVLRPLDIPRSKLGDLYSLERRLPRSPEEYLTHPSLRHSTSALRNRSPHAVVPNAFQQSPTFPVQDAPRTSPPSFRNAETRPLNGEAFFRPSMSSAFEFIPGIKPELQNTTSFGLRPQAKSMYDMRTQSQTDDIPIDGSGRHSPGEEHGNLKVALLSGNSLRHFSNFPDAGLIPVSSSISSLFPFAYPAPGSQDSVLHKTVSPIFVDSSIPFTTYLQNLTKTLRESAARSASESDSEKNERKSDQEPKQTEPDSSCAGDAKHAEDLNDSSPENVVVRGHKRHYVDSFKGRDESEDNENVNDSEDIDRVKRKKEEVEEDKEEEENNSDADKRTDQLRLATHSRRPPPLNIPQRRHSFRELEMEHAGKPFSAPVYPKAPLSASPPSALNSSHPLQPHLHPHPHLNHHRHPRLRISGPSLHFPHPPQDHHFQRHLQHQQQQSRVQPSLQYTGSSPFYNPVFPHSQMSTPSAPHQLTITSPLAGSVPPVGLSPLAGSMGSLFHPAFLGLGGVGMRRPSADKPPPVKKYKCDVCQKAFSRSNTLVTHKRIHTGDKPFKCEVCGRAFRQPGNLTRHRLTHTTHKPYVCHVCSKAFNRASNLNTHIRTHSTFRQFVCSVCPKSFHQKADLASHVFSHTGERPYKCDICGRGFSHTNTLAAHRRTHSDHETGPRSLVDSQCTIFT